MVSNPKTFLTEEEYLAFEPQSDLRHEYFNGEVFAMSGASPEHVKIVRNLLTSLWNQLESRPCEAYSNDLRVKVSATGFYTYPDIVLTCGKENFVGDDPKTLTNPTVIIEVLSDSTETYDRGMKFTNYQGIESLQEYILVSQKVRRLEHYSRQLDSNWLYSKIEDFNSTVILPSVQCQLDLAVIYNRISFDDLGSP